MSTERGIKRKMQNNVKHLQRIPLSFPYVEHKDFIIDRFKAFFVDESCVPSVRYCLAEFVDDEMEANGMEKAVNVISAALFILKNNETDVVLFYEAYCDILDLDTGKYDDLFAKDDLSLLKADIAILKDFFAKHSEFTDPKRRTQI